MKRFTVLGICLAFFLCGCASSRLTVSFQPEHDVRPLARLQRNMSPQEVVQLMGTPERPVEIYFYMNEKEGGFLSRLSKDNYTPLVFVNNKLAGWGWSFLNRAAKNMMPN